MSLICRGCGNIPRHAEDNLYIDLLSTSRGEVEYLIDYEVSISIIYNDNINVINMY